MKFLLNFLFTYNIRVKGHSYFKFKGESIKLKAYYYALLLLPIMIIISLLILIFYPKLFTSIHQQEEKSYTYLGKNAPLPTELNPIVEEKKNTLINQAAKKKIDIVITEGIRSFAKQDQIYQQGRSRPGRIVTYTKAGESYHNYGLAFDFALVDHSGNIIWNTQYDGNQNGKADWYEVADLGKKLGLEWGGDWPSFKDDPHFQMTFGISIEQLKEGYRVKTVEKGKK